MKLLNILLLVLAVVAGNPVYERSIDNTSNDTCEPNTQFKWECNTCTCSEDRILMCTIMYCFPGWQDFLG